MTSESRVAARWLAAQQKKWTVTLFSDRGRALFEKTFEARNEREANEKASKLVSPVLFRYRDAEDWVVEPARR